MHLSIKREGEMSYRRRWSHSLCDEMWGGFNWI